MKPALVAMFAITLADPAPVDDFGPIGREVVDLVRAEFFDADRAARWAEAHADYAAGIEGPDEFEAATNRALKELGASHTEYRTADSPRYYGLLAIFRGPLGVESVEVEGIGADFEGSRFVRVAFAGGQAAQAGLRRGDEVISADGAPFHPIRSFRGREGRPVTLTVRRQADGPTSEVTVAPRRIDPKAEWLEAQRLGAEVVDRGGVKVAIMPFFSCAGAEHEEILREAIAGPFAEADALVLDFRGGWGGASPSFTDLFNPASPRLTMIGRDGEPHPFEPAWHKPLVLLVDEGTTSGKEVVAHALRRHGLATVVGGRTAGAVLGGRPFRLSDGSLLYLAVRDVRVDGERLEGKGVAPDLAVDDPLRYAEGRDPRREAALDAAARLARGERP